MTMPVAPGAPPAPLTQEDRLLAAAAHLSFLVGFWLIAPIAIYVAKRKESRFVAFYALQAALVQIMFAGATGVFIALTVAFAVAAGVGGLDRVAAITALLPILAALLGGSALLGIHLFAAFSAWQGKELRLPVIARIAQAIVRADEGAAKA